MLRTIIRKEVLGHVLTLRFVAGTVFCLVLSLCSALVLTADYQDRIDAYQAAAAHHRQQLDNAWVFSQVTIGVDRPPQPLSLICRGVDSALPTTLSFSLLSPLDASGTGGGRNRLLAIFPNLDMTTVVQVIMSLLALLFAYDTISGERQRGTLALILANRLPRSTLLIGKYLGAMAVLLPLQLMGAGISTAVILASGSVQLTGDDWLVLLWVQVVSAGYLSLVWLAGLVISAMTRYARTSLVAALFLWVTAVIIGPQAASAAASALRPLSSRRSQAMAEQQISSQASTQIHDYARSHPVPLSVPEQRFNVARSSLYSGNVPVLGTLYAAPQEYVAWAVAGARHGVPILVEAAAARQEIRSRSVLEMAAQADLARWLRRLTPAGAYADTVAVLCGTDHGVYQRFWQAAVEHRHRLVTFARSHDGLDFRFFTREGALHLPTYKELAELEQSGQEERLQLLLGKNSHPTPSLELAALSQQASLRTGHGDRLGNAGLDLALLLIESMLLMLIAVLVFARADIRVS